MPSTTIVSLAAVAALLFAGVEGHGKMIFPNGRNMSAKYDQDSGALKNIGLEEKQIGPIELLMGKKQADYPQGPTFNLQNGCRGTVYEQDMPTTTLPPGKDFPLKWEIDAPHPGTMKLNICKPAKNAKGVITYKTYKTLLSMDKFAENGGPGSANVKMPSDVEGCGQPGDCVLQFFWYSPVAKQTYVTCADIVVSGSGGGASTPSAPSTQTSDQETAPSTPTAPKKTPAPTPKPTTAAPKPKAASTTTKAQNDEVAGEADTSKCMRRMRN